MSRRRGPAVHYTAHGCRLEHPDATMPALDPAAFHVAGLRPFEQVYSYTLTSAWGPLGCAVARRAGVALTDNRAMVTCRSCPHEADTDTDTEDKWVTRRLGATVRRHQMRLRLWELCCRDRGAPAPAWPLDGDFERARREYVLRDLVTDTSCGVPWFSFVEKYKALSDDDRALAAPLLELCHAWWEEQVRHEDEHKRIARLCALESDAIIAGIVGDELREARARRVLLAEKAPATWCDTPRGES